MAQIEIVGVRGGSGATAFTWLAANYLAKKHGAEVVVDAHDRKALFAIAGLPSNEDMTYDSTTIVIPANIEGIYYSDICDAGLLVNYEKTPGAKTIGIMRPDYISCKTLIEHQDKLDRIIVQGPNNLTLTEWDVDNLTTVPVLGRTPWNDRIARCIDAGMLLHRNFDMPIVDAMVTL